MSALVIVLFALLVTGPRAVAAGAPPDASPWRAAVTADLEALRSAAGGPAIAEGVMRATIEAAERELGTLDPAEVAPLVLEAAMRAQLRWRLGTPLPRLGAELRQEFRVAMRDGADAGERLRALRRIRRRLERETPGPGGASPRWWMEEPSRGGRSP